MGLVKLDNYDYTIIPDRIEDDLFEGIIRIKMVSTKDPDISDILSELSRCNNKVFVEGYYFLYRNRYSVTLNEFGEVFMDLEVIKEI